jgi:predicted nucleotidyltransferase component of viral defense system
MLTGKGLLDPLQNEFLALFAALPDQDQFYLTGGTALAEYYYGHRLSYDLDFFTGQTDLVLPISYLIEKRCAERSLAVAVVRRFATFVEFSIVRGAAALKVDLALDSPFRFDAPILSEHGVLVNDALDLQVDKVLAYYGRAEPRDAVDLYWIMQHEPVYSLFDHAARKDPGFDLYWMAVALNRAEQFPDELERWPVKMLQAFDPPSLKSAFQAVANTLLGRIAHGPGKAG